MTAPLPAVPSPRVWPVDEPPREHLVNAIAMLMADLEHANFVLPSTAYAVRERIERALEQLDAHAKSPLGQIAEAMRNVAGAQS